jgi:hypothetical protein
VASLVVLVPRLGAAGTYELRENKIKPAKPENRVSNYQLFNSSDQKISQDLKK